MSAKAQDYHKRLTAFMTEFVFPAEEAYDRTSACAFMRIRSRFFSYAASSSRSRRAASRCAASATAVMTRLALFSTSMAG